MPHYHKLNYINGEWVGESANKMEVKNPATSELVGSVCVAGREEIEGAVEGADSAFSEWSKITASERSNYLKSISNLMIEEKEELAKLMTLEMGKPIKESINEVYYAASFLDWYAEEGKRLYGRTIPGKTSTQRIQVIKQPVGVVAAITPWNFPAAMITRKMGPALATGCTFIMKPSKQAPLTALKIAEYCEKAGLPKGVVNTLTGSASQISTELMKNPKVRKITFTGSTEIGKQLIKQSADHVKNISLELGGHAPLIILDDANIEKAVKGAIASKFRNTGQTCVCANRIYVHSRVYDQFIQAFSYAVNELKIGNGLEKDVDIGPIIDRDGYEKINVHVEDAVRKGAQVVTGGEGFVENGTYYYKPTILKNVSSQMLIMNEETFGPVAPVQKIDNDGEAIELANHTPYGLAAYLFTENVSRGTKMAEALEYGIVGWNDGVPSAAQAPFGGMKQSGIGREGGLEGIEEYLETKYISLGL